MRFTCMLHMFNQDVASRSSVAYVAITIHVCCKCMFQLFQTYVTIVLSVCCICCTGYARMLQVYFSNVLAVSNVCSKCFYVDVKYVAVPIHIFCKRML
jgi:hypothetical protein